MRFIFLIATFLIFGCQTTKLGVVPSGSGLDVCADYGTRTNCSGNSYNLGRSDGSTVTSHQGMDFRASPGTPVISATHGLVIKTVGFGCGGGSVTVKTPLKEKEDEREGTLFAKYFHLDLFKYAVKSYTNVKPGDVLGYVSGEEDSCSGKIPHLHFELRFENFYTGHRNPHPYWLNGPYKITCFREGLSVPKDKMVAPMKCK